VVIFSHIFIVLCTFLSFLVGSLFLVLFLIFVLVFVFVVDVVFALH